MSAPPPTFRVEWVPGSDTLRGTCFCGAACTEQEPASLLDWLQGHPDGHRRGAGGPDEPAPPAADRSDARWEVAAGVP